MTTQHPAASASLDLDDLETKARAATPGHWTHQRPGVIVGGPIQHYVNGSNQNQIVMCTGAAEWMRDDEVQSNADFIAAASPDTVLELIALARRATHQPSEADERAQMEAGCSRRYSEGDHKHTSILMRLSTERDAYRAGWKDRAALTPRATTAEQQAACTGAGCADLSCLACGGSGDKPAATTASASIGDDRAFRQRLHSARMAISDAEQQAADAELVAYLDSRTTAPSREAAPQALRHLCDQIDGMKRTMFLRPGTGQNYSYLVHEDVAAYIEEARAALAQQSASPGSRAIDFNKLAVLMTHYLAGNVPDDLYWRVDVTAEVLRRAVAVVRDAAQVQQSAAPGGADFETWWNTPNPKTGQPPSEVIDRNSARYAWEAAQAQAGGSDAQDGAVKLTRDDMGMCIVSLEVDGQWVDVIKDNGDFISHIVEPIGIKAAIDRAAAAARVLTCETCGADRSKERCKAEHWQRCSMMGQAQSAAGQEGGAA